VPAAVTGKEPGGRERHEFAVVGAGLLGLATARALRARGRDVVVFERAEVGNADGGSHGNARIFRFGYPDPGYVAMARLARETWRELESACGRQLLFPTAQLSFGDRLDDLRRAMSQAGAPCELLPAAEAAARFGGIRVAGPCVYEPESCVIAADAALAALAAEVPGLRTRAPVTGIGTAGGEAVVHTGAGSVTARAAIVCAGPWSRALLAGTALTPPTTPTLEQVAYVAPARAQATAPPIFIDYRDRSRYGLPVPGSTLYKVGLHPSGPPGSPGRAGPVTVPGEIAGRREDEDPRLRAELIALVEDHLPGYGPTPAAVQRCVYDNTPDEDFVIDRDGPLVVGCGTSGHGFKFGPLLGEWLADLATGRDPGPLAARFALSRFA
jgi:sarcosine oxidase